MLAQRIATALVLLVVFLAALASSSPWPFPFLMLVLVAAGAWEWGRLCGASGKTSIGLALATVLLVVGSLFLVAIGAMDASHENDVPVDAIPWWTASIAWWLGLALVLRAGVEAWRVAPQWLEIVTGLAILVLTWWAIVHAHDLGVNFLLSTLVIVWASDIAAYFGGKAWGGRIFGTRKLAPSISPGKTWEGAVSGLVGALAVSTFWLLVVDRRIPVDGPSLQGLLVERHGWLAMLLAVVMVTVAGILGDLFESLVKRAAGAKDSSRLLPGHGGVLDRIDALLPVLPMAVALAL